MDMLQCMFKQTRLLQHEYIKLTPAKFFSKTGQIKKKNHAIDCSTEICHFKNFNKIELNKAW